MESVLTATLTDEQVAIMNNFPSQGLDTQEIMDEREPKSQAKIEPTHATTNTPNQKDEEQKVSMEPKHEGTVFELEQVSGKKTYKTVIDAGLLCDAKAWKRVLKEAKDVNDDFKTLRTTIAVVADTVGILHYLMYPSDGAMADQPLCGRILIPKDYPNIPPVVHLLTQTNRANVDAFRFALAPESLKAMQSSMCFDILKFKTNGGTWEPEYTLSALISSLLQAIVSIKVPQMHGGEIMEFVSMEKLGSIHQSVDLTYQNFKAVMPTRKEIVHIQAVKVPTKHFNFPEKITTPQGNQDVIIKSDPFYFKTRNGKDNVFSIGIDLKDLKRNPSTVFSVILSNSPFDPIGKKQDTILLRNGVTATAAKKKAGEALNWFYHGKPMNQSDLKLIVTIGYDQFCISYFDGADRMVVHGDRPVSFLTPAEIGQVDTQRFYLSILLKNKGGPSITVNTFTPEFGYVHPIAFAGQGQQYSA